MGKRRTRTRHSRNSRRKMRGGVDPDNSKSDTGNDDSSMTEQANESDTGNDNSSMTEKASNVVGNVFKWFSGKPQPQPQQTPQTAGRRRRRRQPKMRGGDFSPNSPFTNAMEVQHIQTAPPQTLVGGRRRRKSSRRSRRRRRSSRRH